MSRDSTASSQQSSNASCNDDRNHTMGTDSSGRDFTIGVYPLLPDDACWFLAADFDESDWLIDAQAYKHPGNLGAIPFRQWSTCLDPAKNVYSGQFVIGWRRPEVIDSKWSGHADLNCGPPAPKAGALPGCAMPRQNYMSCFILS
jgi:hypothetical protein